jgi:hypothetical protein
VIELRDHVNTNGAAPTDSPFAVQTLVDQRNFVNDRSQPKNPGSGESKTKDVLQSLSMY